MPVATDKLHQLPDGDLSLLPNAENHQSNKMTVAMMFVGVFDLLLELFVCATLIGCTSLGYLRKYTRNLRGLTRARSAPDRLLAVTVFARVSTLLATVACNLYIGRAIIRKLAQLPEVVSHT